MRSDRNHRVQVLEGWFHRDEIARMCGDPDTPTDILVELVDGRPWMRPYQGTRPDLLASNPSVPADSLVKLIGGAHTARVVTNPSFRVRMAMDPHFVDSLDVEARAHICGCEYTEERLIRYLAASRGRSVRVRVYAARNTQTPQDMLRDYARHDWRVRAALALNPRMPKEAQATLARDKKRIVRINLAQRHDLLEETVEMLVSECPEVVDSALILNPTIPDDVRWRILDALGFGDSRLSKRQRSQLIKRNRKRYGRREL